MSDESLPFPANAGEMHIDPTPDGRAKIAVRLHGYLAWLTQAQMADLFETTPQNGTVPAKNVYDEGELSEGGNL